MAPLRACGREPGEGSNVFSRFRLQQSKDPVGRFGHIKRRGAVAVSLVALFALAAIPATAAPAQKTFTLTAAPGCIPLNSLTAFTYALKNTMPPGGQSFA